LCFHLSASLLVLQTFVRRNPAWLAAAIGWHMILDAGAVFTLVTWDAYVAEGFAGLMALLSLGIVFAIWRRDEQGQEKPTLPPKDPKKGTRKPNLALEEVSEERLHDSRYES
jgi:hypothetical protein